MGVPYAEVIGDPISQSKSPVIHTFWLEKLGIEGDCRATLVAPDDLPAYLADRRADRDWRGCSVTMPHKQTVLPLLDVVEDNRIGAVNCIVLEAGQLVGHNTDVGGFLEPLGDWPGPDAGVQLATLIGTGGAAAAVAWALRREGFLLFVHSRSVERAKAFLRSLGEDDMDFAQSLEVLAGASVSDGSNRPGVAEILVNASPLGMAGQPPLEADLRWLPPDAIVYDLVYDPVETPLLKAARERGLRTISGLNMLVGQAALAFEHFFAQPAPREHDAELRERLTS